MAGRNVLLIEPGYKNKYPPLGLMKIAQYHGPRGKSDMVRFVKGENPKVFDTVWDRVYVTTLFSFEYKKIARSIDFALSAVNGQSSRVFVGGIAASLMHDRFVAEPRWRGIRFIRGLLHEAPALSLQLDQFSEELYSDDLRGTPIEDLVPDYDILDQIDYQYPVRDAYFTYASRGCIRKCSFCGVPKLEGAQRDVSSLSAVVRGIEQFYGPKKDLLLMDNNVVASPKFSDLVAEIRDLGFERGAKLQVGRVPVQRRVDFNQGVDARILAKSSHYLRELATICIRPLRIAFDHLGVKAPYDRAVRFAHEYGLVELSNYMLYNFFDSPSDLFERMRTNVALNEELGIRIWSFPMRYQPTDLPDRSHVGPKWTRYQLRSLQIILQATHGVVTGEPEFFERAFGSDVDAFEDLLLRPHHQIFNREWYERLGGRSEFDEFSSAFARLSTSDRSELVQQLSSCSPAFFPDLRDRATSPNVRQVLPYYFPIAKDEEARIWAKRKELPLACDIADDERVEDAGLDADDEGEVG